VLEIGPGFGVTTRVLARRVDRLSVVELDPGYCQRLRAELGNGGGVTVTQGDATVLPYDAGRFSAVVCFTMLHRIPTVADSRFAGGRQSRSGRHLSFQRVSAAGGQRRREPGGTISRPALSPASA
jgi:hypothetical protein